MRLSRITVLALCTLGFIAMPTLAEDAYSPGVGKNLPRNVYWGDTHVHSRNSADAFNLGNTTLTPDDAYRFARGGEITAHNGMPAKLRRPLDFLVVADHAGYLGAFYRYMDNDPTIVESEVGRRWSAYETATERFADVVNSISEPDVYAQLPEKTQRSIWVEDVVKVADRNNAPGVFTAFTGYEWTSMKDGNNLHRVVIFKDNADKTSQIRPFSAADSNDPEDLWDALANYEKKTGGEVLAIAHNGNLSNSLMFSNLTLSGEPLTKDYAAMRSRYEPLYEVTQIKGDGEAHPLLSPNDEFADYETWDADNIAMSAKKEPWMLQHEYGRSALKLGLKFEAKLGDNPFKFGMIGSTDSHTSLATAAEDNFFGKFPESEPGPQRITNGMAGYMWENWRITASGYAGIWAEENTREALFEAMQRREVYATTGSRITVRFFGGWDYQASELHRPDYVEIGYAKGVPMGGDLSGAPKNIAPSFIIAAAKDPDGANLDRVQIVKGWLDEKGELQEQVYDVAYSGDRSIDTETGKLADVGNTVDIKNASYTNTIGSPLLSSVWRDPDFDAQERAFYYARVIEIPTPRWPVYDAKYFDFELPEEVPVINRDRAYTSPIWYTPET
ncbi:MAG: DUF3604 domain-containing protein [Halioglobus sp.]